VKEPTRGGDRVTAKGGKKFEDLFSGGFPTDDAIEKFYAGQLDVNEYELPKTRKAR
jgi:hypothetical protein